MIDINFKSEGEVSDISLSIIIFGSNNRAEIKATVDGKESAINFINIVSRVYFIRNLMVATSAIITALNMNNSPLKGVASIKVASDITNILKCQTLKETTDAFNKHKTAFSEWIDAMKTSNEQKEKAAGEMIGDYISILSQFAEKVK